MTRPREVRLSATEKVEASASELMALVLDFDRYESVEPRLKSVRWLSGDRPAVGAQARVVADIPYTLALARALFGSPDVIATVTAWSPPYWITVEFSAARFQGWVALEVEQELEVTVVSIDGAVWPRPRSLMLLLGPLQPQLERLARRAIRRAVRRANNVVVAELGQRSR